MTEAPWFEPAEASRLVQEYEAAFKRIADLAEAGCDAMTIFETVEDALAEKRREEGKASAHL